jgi:FkbM family methyltransferase
MRLYPHGNICEKTALFTPQMFDSAERAELVRQIETTRAEGRRFSFLDIGANVGLYSLFVASAPGGEADIIAIEPEPTSCARLRFHAAANPWVSIRIQPVALGDSHGAVALEINRDNRGGTRTRPATSADRVVVPCMSLLEFLSGERTERVDAMKIDIEGNEAAVLSPFFRDAPQSLWPRMIIIEADGKSRALAELKLHGYRIVARTRAAWSSWLWPCAILWCRWPSRRHLEQLQLRVPSPFVSIVRVSPRASAILTRSVNALASSFFITL